MNFPFNQKVKDDLLIREFSKDIDPNELVWHRDRYDRQVFVTEGSGWLLQIDNKLPVLMEEGSYYHIPKNTYHRVIKGSTNLVLEIKEFGMKVTRRQLRQIIKESIDLINNETGEVLIFADDDEYGEPDAPEAALSDVMKRLDIKPAPSSPGYQADRFQQSIDVSAEDWEDVYDEVVGKKRTRKRKKERTRLNLDNLMTRLEDWALNAREDYMADNPGVDMQNVAMDLAQGAKYSFEPDEWEKIYYSGPFDSDDDLYTYIADLIA